MTLVYAAVLGFVFDLIFGDPKALWHPVVFIGRLISFCEKKLRGSISEPDQDKKEKTAGVMLVLVVCASVLIVVLLATWVAYRIDWRIGVALQSFWCWRLLAAKGLASASIRVYTALKTEGIESARKNLSMIVGRDTDSLSEEQIIKAAVETVAENTADGVCAPLFYFLIGGAPLMFLYKAVNTMDSMIGYKNDAYINFGRCAAKLDDALNYVPSRLCAVCMIAACFVIGLDAKNAARIFKRDRYNHASPNSAQTESVCAGALNIRLAGNAVYFGRLYEKLTIGDANRNIEAEDIKRANHLMYVSAFLCLILFGALRFAVFTVL